MSVGTDKETRSRLARMVAACRDLLSREIVEGLQSDYGIQPSGESASLSDLRHLDERGRITALLLRDGIAHLEAGADDRKRARAAAVDRLVREQAFTVLNRFAALRMCEERGLVQECVHKGYQSKGFKLFLTTAGTGLGGTYQRYRAYLLSLFDELSSELGALFDRYSPHGLVFPGEHCLEELLGLINAPDMDGLWAEDETIGWIYQYFNTKEERERMRKESGAPRNTRELAVRNQFFTPRYVVQFLVDNSLGRIWYEMTRGRSGLGERCSLMLLTPAEAYPERPLKDPREIRFLDPACGSMHFGLYAFDIFEAIYEEAWDFFPHLLSDLREKYQGDKAAFLSRVPGLILEHNIHGIEIDRRAAQIAGLALWLRAQKSFQRLGCSAEARPRIRRSRVVCVEPMPGEKSLLDELVLALKPSVLGQLVQAIWGEMKLAGTAGSLLRIEDALESGVMRARKEWQRYRESLSRGALFPDELRSAFILRTGFDPSEIEGEGDWQQIEVSLLSALERLAEAGAEASGYTRRLFADDAIAGFAFIDLCRLTYDVVVMNPPFGEAAKGSKEYIAEWFPRTKNDLYAAFIERGLQLLNPGGRLGAITSRTGFFLSTFQQWREEILLGEARPVVVADLGFGVLDAMVETAAYCLEKAG